VLLCAGRRLAELGLNLVLADAHLADPQLACRLGLLPESGWEDVVAGRLPLVEVVIESAIDRLAVLPVRQTPAGANGGNQDEARLVESIRTLAAHYDLVLLDPGPLEELGVAGASLARGIGSRLDAIVLVHRHGVTPPEDLDEVRRSLAETEIVQAGVVENFVRD
jgi:Mrp family chromosome partitioning ATPase